MLKIGITGQQGFVGRHLYNTLGLYPELYERIPFSKFFFDHPDSLDVFVSKCDVVIHLAAMNRHHDANQIYETNINLVNSLIASLKRTRSTAHVLMASSTQEEQDNLYGKSKKDGRLLFEEWAKSCDGVFTGLIIPNVFGPFGKANYNSVVATFCHKLAHQETPQINIDSQLNLIYIGELVSEILKKINDATGITTTAKIEPTFTCTVSYLLELLSLYKSQYLEKGIIPSLTNSFEINLFNTFRCYMDLPKHFPVAFKQNIDERGSFVEVVRLNIGGQVSFSTTVPGVTRGNHFHTRKIERFAVIKGKALIQLRQIGTDTILNFELDGTAPTYVDMPIWYTHNITNIGDEELYTIFWINEFYNPNDSDTFFENV